MRLTSLSDTVTANAPVRSARSVRGDNAALFAIAAAVTVLHLLTNGRYGFHRDELQFLSDARHMDWGFVAYPPFTALVERISMTFFGLSMVGLRLFSVVAQATAILVTGLMARELGGQRLAQVTAALAVALSGIPLFEGTEFQYTTFDYLWWVLIAWSVIRLLKSENPRWWLAVGAAAGLGLETKYAIVFFLAGLLAGIILTPARRYLLSAWFWGGVAVALIVFLPNFIWLARHDFISYHFLQHIHARDVGEGRANGFIRSQFLSLRQRVRRAVVDRGPVGLPAPSPLPHAGLDVPGSRRVLLLCQRSRLLRGRCVSHAAGHGRGHLRTLAGRTARLGAAHHRDLSSLPACAAYGSFVIAGWVPLAASGPLRAFALQHSGDLREEIGWDELVRTVAQIRDSLPPDQQAHLGITTGNYGEYGAIDILGRAYGLPEPIGTTNSEWLRGYPATPPTTLIVLGIRPEEADQIFTGCRVAGHNGNAEGIHNEEHDDHPWIFVCGPPRKPWPEVWNEHKDFG